MNKALFDREKILERLEDIKTALEELQRFKSMSLEEFQSNRDYFPVACYWLRIALEAILNIGTHILSRLPFNGKKKDYTQLIISLGDYGVIPRKFAQKIRGMVGYRNRLVHLYWRVSPEELLLTLRENLGDFEKFSKYILRFLEDT
ncbi:MAG TPA: DUF86 domain-containing protein [Candidatus Omnitrophica bacterium]|nr:DUF86 domain-containing protein [Candidatus Omnitrophota bacterium]